METQIVNTDTLVQATNVVERIIPLFIWAMGGLSVAVTAMAIHIVKQQKIIINLQRESTVALTKTHLLIDSNTKTHDKILEYFVKKSK